MPTTTTGTPIARLYFFDDLTYHLRRISTDLQLSTRDIQELLTASADHVHHAMTGLDPAQQTAVHITWDHACTQLAYDLHHAGTTFDLLVSQGCNGRYAADSLLSEYASTYGQPLAAATTNVRSTHLLTNPDDAFHSDFQIAVSGGAPLDQQCHQALAGIQPRDNNPEPVRIAVFDDCIQTGHGTQAVTEHLLDALPAGQAAKIHTVGFVACQATQHRFAQRDWHPAQGVLLPGQTYPTTWDTDIYFLKDLILTNAIRYTNGTSHAYIDNPAWMANIFTRDPHTATHTLSNLRDLLTERGIYQHLLDM